MLFALCVLCFPVCDPCGPSLGPTFWWLLQGRWLLCPWHCYPPAPALPVRWGLLSVRSWDLTGWPWKVFSASFLKGIYYTFELGLSHLDWEFPPEMQQGDSHQSSPSFQLGYLMPSSQPSSFMTRHPNLLLLVPSSFSQTSAPTSPFQVLWRLPGNKECCQDSLSLLCSMLLGIICT